MKKNLSERVLNSKVGKQFSYILECIDTCSAADYQGKEFETDLERIAFFWQGFKNYDYPSNKKRIPNLQLRVADWLQGLPEYLNVDFENYKIIEIGKSWGYCSTERKENEFINNWFKNIALRLIQIANKLGYSLTNIY